MSPTNCPLPHRDATDSHQGKTKDGEDVSGTITIPEVAHDTEEDEYVVRLIVPRPPCGYLLTSHQFETDVYSESLAKTPVKDLVRSQIIPKLRSRFQQLGPALVAEHGKDIQHAADHKDPWPAAKVYSSSSVAKQGDEPKSSSTTTTTSSGKGPSVNVTSLSDQEEFRCDAATLYQIFTDPQRIAAFTRSPPKTFEGARPGGKFELFGGNVSGEYVELKEPTAITQRWRLAQWPQGHYSTLCINFEQNNVDAVTIMRVEWSGVPIGQEEPTKRNWGEYYVR